MWVDDVVKQPDGRYTLTFKEDDKTFIQENMALCCVGSHHNDTGNDSDTRIYTTHFEVIQCFHPLKEQV